MATEKELEAEYQRWVAAVKAMSDEEVVDFIYNTEGGEITFRSLETHPDDPFLQRLNRDLMKALDDLHDSPRRD